MRTGHRSRRLAGAVCLLVILTSCQRANDASTPNNTESYAVCKAHYAFFKVRHRDVANAAMSDMAAWADQARVCLEGYGLSDTTAWLTEFSAYAHIEAGQLRMAEAIAERAVVVYAGRISDEAMQRLQRQQYVSSLRQARPRLYFAALFGFFLALALIFLVVNYLNLGPRIELAMKQAGIGAVDLSRAVKPTVTPQTVYAWIRGDKVPNLKRLVQIKELTHKPLAWFFLDEEMPELPATRRAPSSPPTGQPSRIRFRTANGSLIGTLEGLFQVERTIDDLATTELESLEETDASLPAHQDQAGD